MRIAAVVCCLLASMAVAPAAQESRTAAGRRIFDAVLDLYVRDGLVYYRALKLERANFDRYIASIADASIDAAPREERLAFWLNAYDALVLRTVIDHYPIARRSQEYPEHSIRQIPGAFERVQHRVGGRLLTLDAIEQTILSSFHDPRVYFAIGRGAMASGRLRSETFTPERLEAQLTEVAAECVSRAQCVQIDRTTGQVNISSIFSWRSADFIDAYAAAGEAAFASRSPIERAALAFVGPRLLAAEKTLLAQNQFKVAFKPFDWSLNDLTGRGGQ
jgi:uncharacterized protein DUF547